MVLARILIRILARILAGILAGLGLPVIGGLGELFVAVRIDWVELEQVWQWEEFADGRRFAFCGVVDQFGDDEGARHANTEAQGSGSQGCRVLVGDQSRGGRGGLCKESRLRGEWFSGYFVSPESSWARQADIIREERSSLLSSEKIIITVLIYYIICIILVVGCCCCYVSGDALAV